jgi:hypothetical protein
MKPEVVNKIAEITESLAPDTPFYRHQRLFSERDFDLYEEKGNYEEQQKELEARRQKAVYEVFLIGGTEAVLEFAEVVESPWRVGFAFGVIAHNNDEEKILPGLLESKTIPLTQFAGGYIVGRFREHDWQWVDSIETSKWTPSQKGQLLAHLPFTSDTWKRVTRFLEEDESPYWSKTNANPFEAKEGLELAADRLVQFDRPYAAIRCLERLQHKKQPLDGLQAVRVLQAVLRSPEDPRAMDVHAIVEVIKALQDDPDTRPDDIFQIEWAFLPLLDRYHREAYPKFLEQRLADDPAFFYEVIRAAFKSKNKERPIEEPTEQQKNIAQNAYRLLSEWRTPPGSQNDGTFNGDALTNWLKDVKTACAESGHLDIALSMVGRVLIHTPPDADGLWLHHSAAMALNDKDASEMRSGFRTALFNSRGAHWVDPEGKEERELANKYRIQAEEVDGRGYHRLASTLRKLADGYERDAERQAAEELFDD